MAATPRAHSLKNSFELQALSICQGVIHDQSEKRRITVGPTPPWADPAHPCSPSADWPAPWLRPQKQYFSLSCLMRIPKSPDCRWAEADVTVTETRGTRNKQCAWIMLKPSSYPTHSSAGKPGSPRNQSRCQRPEPAGCLKSQAILASFTLSWEAHALGYEISAQEFGCSLAPLLHRASTQHLPTGPRSLFVVS